MRLKEFQAKGESERITCIRERLHLSYCHRFNPEYTNAEARLGKRLIGFVMYFCNENGVWSYDIHSIDLHPVDLHMDKLFGRT